VKILSFAVWCECENCHGQKRVPGGQREYGELVNCAVCGGSGRILGETPYEDFAKLIRAIAPPSTKGLTYR
jgi:DnaJ-class molecular chaperone